MHERGFLRLLASSMTLPCGIPADHCEASGAMSKHRLVQAAGRADGAALTSSQASTSGQGSVSGPAPAEEQSSLLGQLTEGLKSMALRGSVYASFFFAKQPARIRQVSVCAVWAPSCLKYLLWPRLHLQLLMFGEALICGSYPVLCSTGAAAGLHR